MPFSFQVSEPRNPCYKLAAKYDVPNQIVQVRITGYTAFLLKVLKEGVVSVHDHTANSVPSPSN
ncbi:6-N-hydroxylaminopurine resistance protein [compost metagenome]